MRPLWGQRVRRSEPAAASRGDGQEGGHRKTCRSAGHPFVEGSGGGVLFKRVLSIQTQGSRVPQSQLKIVPVVLLLKIRR